MGLADGEGAGDAIETEGAEWAGSGEEEVAVVVAGVPDTWGVEVAEDMAVTGEPKTGKRSDKMRQKTLNVTIHIYS